MESQKKIRVRCYAERESDGSWFGICIDLNLAAQGDTLEEVRQKLDAQVQDYLDEAFGEDSEYLHDLVPRRAPMSFIFRYYWIKLMCWLRRIFDDRDGCGNQRILPSIQFRHA